MGGAAGGQHGARPANKFAPAGYATKPTQVGFP